MIELYNKTSMACSKITTINYSTSFSLAIRLLHKSFRQDIYNIYGFVRLADEIVDTFHDYNKPMLLDNFCRDTYHAIEQGISLNPILHSFQQTVHKYGIDMHLIDAFFKSMKSDLTISTYADEVTFKEYIYGSAEVVGLMCLYIFCEGKNDIYETLKSYAQRLGAAFQKVNFLRDIKNDYHHLNRIYFPGCDFSNFNEYDKLKIEIDIERDFRYACEGIHQLPAKAKFGVYIAYKYYYALFQKIKKTDPQLILEKRIRISDYGKIFILVKAGVSKPFKLL